MEREKECELEYARMKQEGLRLAREERAPGDPGGSLPQSQISRMAKLLPKFDECDPDLFFSLFERLAKDHQWSDSNCVLLLQSVITGKAQQAYIALDDLQCKEYKTVKQAILKAYELMKPIDRNSETGAKMRNKHTWS